jgi:hypothetical protein
MLLSNAIKFQKTLALAAAASNEYEAAAAEFAARRLMDTHAINPTVIPNASLYNRMSFTDNVLLKKLRAEWREQHPPPVSVTPNETDQVTQRGTAPRDTQSIPFNMDGFLKHTRKRKSRQPRVVLFPHDYETIRLLLNQGYSLSEIAERTGFKTDTLNSTRAWHVRSGKWVRDNGQFHWADHFQAPAPTNPQPTEANSEENESTLVP